LSVLHNRVAVCDILNIRHDMSRNQHNPLLRKLRQYVAEAYALTGVKAACRFVQN
jgi:hypothetical protein